MRCRGGQPGSRGRDRQLPFAASTARGGAAHRIELQRLGGLKFLRLLEFLGCHVNSPSPGIGARIRPLLVNAERPGKLAQFFARRLGENTRGSQVKCYFTCPVTRLTRSYDL